MKGKVSMFCGHSGVGKSALVNAFSSLDLKTEGFSTKPSGSTHHTFAKMFDLGTSRINAGNKGFGIMGIKQRNYRDILWSSLY